jgi:diacylglycerol kinase family enzyme
MKIEEFVPRFAEFLRSKPFVENFSEVHIIVNPAAGGFTQGSLYRKTIESFKYWRSLPAVHTVKSPAETIRIHWTESPGHCENIVAGIIEKSAENKRILIITAGGDGTATEAASELYKLKASGGNPDNIILFRLPLGTGNDGLDAATMDEVFRLAGGGYTINKIPLLQIDFASGGRKYATNVGSFGLDAYVTVKANNLKKIIPGSFYASMVDVAALFYDFTVPMVPYQIQ